MLQGVEYLTTINGFTPILGLIQGMNEATVNRRGILLIALVPDSLDKREEALLASETTPLPAPTPMAGTRA